MTESKTTLSKLNSLYDKHVSYMKLMRDNDLLTEEKKKKILQNIEDIYEMTDNSYSNNKRSRGDDSDTDIDITNSNSKAS